jgi:dGTP triphosphohydrolase
MIFAEAQLAATTGAPWWVVVVSGVVSAIVTAPATLAVVRAREKRFGAEHGFAAQAFGRSEEERRAIERDRDAKVQENASLLAENVQLRHEIIDMRDDLDECKAEIVVMKADLRSCHSDRTQEAETHAANMQSLALWMTGELARVGIKSEPPRLRSITPRDMPAVSKE